MTRTPALAPEVINDVAVVAEVKAVFERYEQALVSNDTDTLDALFWHSEQVVRYGNNEHLYGIDAIREFRRQRPSKGLSRRLTRCHITTYGSDFATVWTEFARPNAPPGRQTQTWLRLPEGWRIVAAHVSAMG